MFRLQAGTRPDDPNSNLLVLGRKSGIRYPVVEIIRKKYIISRYTSTAGRHHWWKSYRMQCHEFAIVTMVGGLVIAVFLLSSQDAAAHLRV